MTTLYIPKNSNQNTLIYSNGMTIEKVKDLSLLENLTPASIELLKSFSTHKDGKQITLYDYLEDLLNG